MMDHIRAYILSVVTAAMICAVIIRLTGEHDQIIKMVVALFLAFCVIRPIAGTDLSGLIDTITEDWSSATASPDDWKDLGTQALRSGIKERTEAYVVSEAQALGAVVDVDVRVSEDELPVPEAVTIKGDVSPYLKIKLSHILTSDLGIEKEALEWT